MNPIAISLAAVLLLAPADPDTTKITLDLQNVSINDVLSRILALSDVPVVLDAAALKKLGDPAEVRVSVKVRDLSVTSVAQLLFQPHGLAVKVVEKRKVLVTVK